MIPELKGRGYFLSCTDETQLADLFSSQKLTFYLGFDCTAKSLHLGHLVPLMMLRQLEKAGHNVIALLGGATTKIGDPSGKDKERSIIPEEEIYMNMSAIKKSIGRFIKNPTFVNNADWLEKLSYIDFLQDVGRHFSVNKMLTFDCVKTRLARESHLSFLEFNYMILQAYDFVELNRSHGCRVQIGGSDQWGNIVSGIELGRRLGLPQLFGITVPLITTASGKKMGKTESGAIFLDAELCSPYEYWQYFRNTEDPDVERFLLLFTELDIDHIKNLCKDRGASINDAKKILATEATQLCHGEIAANDALLKAESAFERTDTENFPILEIQRSDDLLSIITNMKAAPSRSKAKELLRAGAVKINGERVEELEHPIRDGFAISIGKKRVKIRVL